MHSICEGESIGVFKGMKINHSAPSVSHLMFADDLIIFDKASTPNLEKAKHILDIDSSWLGQVINYARSSIFFINNLSDIVKKDLAGVGNILKALTICVRT